MRKNKKTLLIWFMFIFVVLLSSCAEVSQKDETITDVEAPEEDMEYVVKPVVGDVYISSVYNQVATDLDIKSVEPNSDAERYQNPNALAQRVLEWGGYSWNLTYAFSDTMDYVDFDIDFYRVGGTEKYAYVTFKKDTDQLVKAYNLPLSQGFFEAFTEDSYREITDSIIDTFCDMPLENMTKEEYTTYTVYGDNLVEGGHTQAGFYVTQEGEKATFRLTSYYEKLEDKYTTLKHVVVEYNSYDDVVIEVYDIDTEGLANFLKKQDVSVVKDFSNHMENQMHAKGYEFISAEAPSLVWYEKNGEYCSRFMGSVEYKTSEGNENTILADFIMKYQK